MSNRGEMSAMSRVDMRDKLMEFSTLVASNNTCGSYLLLIIKVKAPSISTFKYSCSFKFWIALLLLHLVFMLPFADEASEWLLFLGFVHGLVSLFRYSHATYMQPSLALVAANHLHFFIVILVHFQAYGAEVALLEQPAYQMTT